MCYLTTRIFVIQTSAIEISQIDVLIQRITRSEGVQTFIILPSLSDEILAIDFVRSGYCHSYPSDTLTNRSHSILK